jgi:hypothetical protein
MNKIINPDKMPRTKNTEIMRLNLQCFSKGLRSFSSNDTGALNASTKSSATSTGFRAFNSILDNSRILLKLKMPNISTMPSSTNNDFLRILLSCAKWRNLMLI